MNTNLVPSPYLELLTLRGSHDGLDPQGPMSCDYLEMDEGLLVTTN